MAHRMTKPERPGLAELGAGLWGLVFGYFKQETLVPIKALGRYVAFGLAGSVMAVIGLVLLDVAGLRALQEDTGSVFAGNLSWVPYVVCAVGTLAVLVLAGLAIVRKPSRLE